MVVFLPTFTTFLGFQGVGPNFGYKVYQPILSYTEVCPPISETVHSLKLADYRLYEADKPWYDYYISCLTYKTAVHTGVDSRQMFSYKHFS